MRFLGPLILTLFTTTFLLSLSYGSVTAGIIKSHSIEVRLRPEERGLEGVDRMTLKKGAKGRLRLLVNKRLHIDSIRMGKEVLLFEEAERPEGNKELTINLSGGDARLSIHFHGGFKDLEEARGEIKKGVAHVDDGVMGEDWVFLPASSLWHPLEEGGLAYFNVTVYAPSGFESIMEGVLIERKEKGGASIRRWKTEGPLDGINLVSGRYVISKETHRGVDIFTYFFEENKKLTETYIEWTEKYLDLYKGLFPPYPYKKFAVVESALPTGYGMPSFTLLGSRVLMLPFIPRTSLGHEIVHNWWGNSVFLEEGTGNWVEALTTYTADHFYREMEGPESARRFRFEKLVGYASFAGSREITLREFSDLAESSSRAVGYNKGFFVFHMLKKLLGKDLFFEGLGAFYIKNAFRRASWEDIQRAFEEVSGKRLGWFFNQWLNRRGGPVISMGEVRSKTVDRGYLLSFEVLQKGPPYALDLEVVFKFPDKSTVTKQIHLDMEKEMFEFILHKRPVYFEVDPGYHVFRRLFPEEIPPSLGSFLGHKGGVMAVPGDKEIRERYEPVIEKISRDYNIEVVEDEAVKERAREKGPLFVLGNIGENLLTQRIIKNIEEDVELKKEGLKINKRPYSLKDTVIVICTKDRRAPDITLCLMAGERDRKGMERIARRLPHFSSKGYLVFKRDGSVESGAFEGKRPLRYYITNHRTQEEN